MLTASFVTACAREDQHPMLVRYRPKLEWSFQKFALYYDDESMAELCKVVMDYDAQFGHTPSLKELSEYWLLRGHQPNEFGFDTENLRFLQEEIEKLVKENDIAITEVSEMETLIMGIIDSARKAFHSAAGKTYTSMARGNVEVGKHEHRRATINDAMAYMRAMWAKDLPDMIPQLSGPLDENKPAICEMLDAYRNSVGSERLVTGLESVDATIPITRTMRPMVGIMGHAHSGKTTLLTSMAYNTALSGRNIAIFSKEHQAQSVWTALALLHSYQYREEFVVPGLSKWQNGQVTDERDMYNMARVLRDIEERTTLPGRIDVQPLKSWEQVVQHLEANDNMYRYDAVFIDYLTDIPTPGVEAKWRNQAIADILGKAQCLTRNFMDRGIILVTPCQTNREAEKNARKSIEQEADAGTNLMTLTGVRQHSEFYQLVDVLFGIFADENMHRKGEAKLETLKARECHEYPMCTLQIDSESRMVCELSSVKTIDADYAMATRPVKNIAEELVITIDEKDAF